jgi:hypothetical protein
LRPRTENKSEHASGGMRRRTFLKGTAFSAGLGVLEVPSLAVERDANDRIRFGVIGCGGMGSGHVRSLVQRGEADQVGVSAVSDVYQRRLTRAKEAAPGAEGYADYRRLLDRKDIDAVLIATPDHWHAKLSIETPSDARDASSR